MSGNDKFCQEMINLARVSQKTDKIFTESLPKV